MAHSDLCQHAPTGGHSHLIHYTVILSKVGKALPAYLLPHHATNVEYYSKVNTTWFKHLKMV